MHNKVDTSLNFVDRERAITEFWKKNKIFEKSTAQNEGGKDFVFFDGPPTANGKPHIGHILTRVMKDIIPRYQTMKGCHIERKAGWDTHGLPVELEVEKLLGINGKPQIEKYGIDVKVEASKVTSDYNAHICEGIATGDPCIALAAVLPCMWIYNMVGLHILRTARLENNPYKEWILEYGNEEFTQGVNTVLEMVDKWADQADEETRKKMDYYYLKAALYEYAFWDYGYCADAKSYDYTDSLEEWL